MGCKVLERGGLILPAQWEVFGQGTLEGQDVYRGRMSTVYRGRMDTKKCYDPSSSGTCEKVKTRT